VITARMDYLPRVTPARTGGSVEMAGLAAPRRPWCRCTPGAATTTRCCAAAADTGDRLAAEVGPLGHRVFTDSAPVLEVELATRSGLGWRGKHTLPCTRDAGSMFFLGEIFVDLALPPDRAGRRPLRQLQRLHRRSAPRRPSSRPTGWTRGAASAT
jgi:epoxyqueuosine reductase